MNGIKQAKEKGYLKKDKKFKSLKAACMWINKNKWLEDKR